MSFELTQKEGEFVVRLARQAVEEYLKTKKIIHAPKETPSKLTQPSGVFVTINSVERGKKELRGCIGYPYPTDPLTQAVIQSAISAATEDPRFYSISQGEVERVLFEISVLTPPQLVEAKDRKDYPMKIRIGEDGLIVEKGIHKGLLLPQVPVEWGWDTEEFLCQCCIKAGLPPDSWLLKETKIFKFQAIIFEEEKPKGEVKRETFSRK